MEIRVMSWNLAGAKLFERLDPGPGPASAGYVTAFRHAWERSILPWLSVQKSSVPDIILLQECIGFEDSSCSPSDRWQSGAEILGQIFAGYDCFFFPAVTSKNNPHPEKWNRYARGGGLETPVPVNVDIQQGYGICIRKGVSIRKLWVPWQSPADVPSEADRPDPGFTLCFEAIGITTGLYQGNRDTEPRMVIMGRVRLESGDKSRYLNYLNVHLNTLHGEREGNLRLNRSAGASRLHQVELILDHIVSAYQEASRYRVQQGPQKDERDIWIMGGDFNTAPDSAEIALIRRAGFVDTQPDKRIEDEEAASALHGRVGSKWSLADKDESPIVTDYIFCGLEQFTFPADGLDTSGSRRPFKPRFGNAAFATDHAVLFTSIRVPEFPVQARQATGSKTLM